MTSNRKGKVITLYLDSKKLYEALKKKCQEEDRSASNYVSKLLKETLYTKE